MYQTYKEKADFYIVYILEAHPTDGWQVPQNERENVEYAQPKTYEERVKVAGDCMKGLKITIPCLVDDMKNSAQKGYAGWPDRFYVVDKSKKVAFKGDPGPAGFKPKDAEDALKKLLEGK